MNARFPHAVPASRALSIRAPSAVVMVRPHHFRVNTETAADNRFQVRVDDAADLAQHASGEITRAATRLSPPRMVN